MVRRRGVAAAMPASAASARPLLTSHARSNRRETYLAPPSHRIVTTVWPGPSSRATRTAAATLMPLVLPRKRPSSCSNRYTICTVSVSSTCTAESIGAPLKLSVTRAMPMPSVIEPLPVDLISPLRTNS